MTKKSRITIFLLTLITVSLLCLMLPIILGIKIETITYSFLALLAVNCILFYLTEKTKNKILQKISFIFSIPLSIIHLIFSLGMPTGVLLFNAYSGGYPFSISGDIRSVPS